jgi:7-carboxy-7-deazaguanine synthase
VADKKYMVNECFYSLQGEGVRAGTANVFVRFSGCNLQCSMEPGSKSPGGFDCDTEFQSGRSCTLEEIYEWIRTSTEIATGKKIGEIVGPNWLILTGGEPGLQVDQEFCNFFHKEGYQLAIETNGTIDLMGLGLNWITLSPKVAEHAVKQLWANELKYVRGFGQGIPKPTAKADHYLISPAADGNMIHPKTLQWCQKLVLENPQWRLSVQQHKYWGVR